MKTGILLAAFGSSQPTAHRELTGFEERVRLAFPGVPARWAFTSGVIRNRLAGEGVKTDSVAKALSKMWFEKFDRVAVQSLHVVPGAEYGGLCAAVADMGPGGAGGPAGERFAAVALGAPLLDREEDTAQVAAAILRHLPEERGPGEPVILMGHGTWHEGDSRYAPLAQAVRRLDPAVFLATMNGARTLRHVLKELEGTGVVKVWLLPLMAVAGAHAVQDMAGDGPDSWKSQLARAGIGCEVVLRGIAGYDAFADIWIDHLRQALESLGPKPRQTP